MGGLVAVTVGPVDHQDRVRWCLVSAHRGDVCELRPEMEVPHVSGIREDVVLFVHDVPFRLWLVVPTVVDMVCVVKRAAPGLEPGMYAVAAGVLLPCGREDEPRLTCPSFGGPVAVASEQVGVEHRIPASSGEVDSSVLANPTAPANLGDVEPVPAHEPGHVALGDPVAALARPAILANHLDFNLREHCVSSRLWLLILA